MRRIFLLIILILVVGSVFGQTAPPSGFDLTNHGVRIEPDRRVMLVLATLEMARGGSGKIGEAKLIPTPLSDANAKFRERLLKDTADLPEDLRFRISNFVAQYKKRHPQTSDADTIAPFISMAYTLTPVPELADPIITNDLPGNLLDVLDFAPLVREFYRRSAVGALLDDYVKDYRTEADGNLRRSSREMVSDMLDYLHTRPRLSVIERTTVETRKDKSKITLAKSETREIDRRFFIVPERLAARHSINFLNIRDDYHLIVPPDADLGGSDTRRAFLQFVIDPLMLANTKEMTAMREWARPLLDERRIKNPALSPDIYLAITRSLVAAIDVRQSEYLQAKLATERAREQIGKLGSDAEKRKLSADLEKFKRELADEAALRLFEDYEKGALLSFYFSEQLKGIEDSGFDIASSLREMIVSFAPAREAGRDTETAEARRRAMAVRAARLAQPDRVAVVAENPVTTRLLEIQKTINAKDFAKAGVDLRQLLAAHPNEPRIHFNIGRVAGLSAVGVDDEEMLTARLGEAKNAYENVLKNATPTTDRTLLSLTYVALGRIYERYNDNEYAMKLYDQAIRVDASDAGGRLEALAAKQRLLKP